MLFINYVCKRCENENITFSLDAKWNVNKQCLDYESQPYVVFCHDCDDETNPKQIQFYVEQ